MSSERPALGRTFWRYWWAATTASSANGMVAVTLPLLAVAATTDPLHVSLVMLALRLPWAVFGLVAGAVIDRRSARPLLIAADLTRMAIVAATGVLALWTDLTLATLLVTAFAVGSATVVFECAAQAWLTRTVTRERLGTANGHLETGRQADRMLGPALGGALTAAAPALPMLLNAVAFGGSAWLLRGAPEAPSDRVSGTRLRDDVRSGLALLRRNRFVRLLALTLTVLAGLQSGALAVQVLLGLEVLDLTPTQYGVFVGGAAVGGLAGAVTAGRLVEPHRLWLLPAAILSAATGYTGMVLTTDPRLAGAALAVENFGIGLGNVTIATLRMAAVPAALQGRIAAVFRILLHTAVSAGAVLGGLLAGPLGLRAPYLLAVAGYLLLLATAVPALYRHRPELPAHRARG